MNNRHGGVSTIAVLLGIALLIGVSFILIKKYHQKPHPTESGHRAGQFLIEQMPLPAPPATPPNLTRHFEAPKDSVSFRTRRRRVRNLPLKSEISRGLRPLEMTRVPQDDKVKKSLVSSPNVFIGDQPDPRLRGDDAHLPDGQASRQMILSPRRFLQRIDRVPENVIVLSHADLKNLPANDPSEALSYVSSIDVTQRTKFGHFTPLSIQGSESRHVLVMVDGIPFNTQASGQADILPALSLTPLERIEIVQGAASSAWGYGLGGVVHLITKEPRQSTGQAVRPEGSVSTAWSEFRGQTQSVEAGGSAGKLSYYLSSDYREAAGAPRRPTGLALQDGVQNREDVLQKKGFGKLIYHFTDLVKLASSFGYSGAEVNEGVYPTDGTRNKVPYYARYGQVRLSADPDERRNFETAVKFNRQRIQTDNLDGTTGDLFSTTKVQDHYYGVEIKSVTKFREQDTLVGGYDISGSILKTNLTASSKNVLIQAPYGSYTWAQGPAELSTGARYDINEEYGGQMNPSFGALYRIEGPYPTVLRVNSARAFSAPPLLWKYFEDIVPGLTVNNPDLRPERAWVYEAGVDTQVVKGFRVGARVFRSDISDAITTVLNEDGFFMKQNFKKFRSTGFEFTSTAQIAEPLTLSFAATFNDVEDRATRLTVQNRGVTRPGFRIGADYHTPGGFQFQALGRYNRWDSSSALEPNDRKLIFDGRISKKITHGDGLDLTAYLNAYNLTNSKYWMARDFPLPERYFEGGASLEF